MGNTDNNQNLFPEIDFNSPSNPQISSFGVSESKDIVSSKVSQTLGKEELDLSSMLEPDDTFLKSTAFVDSNHFSIKPAEKFVRGESLDVFPDISAFQEEESEIPINFESKKNDDGKTVNTQKTYTDIIDFLNDLPEKEHEIKNFLLFIYQNKDSSEFLSKKIIGFFTGVDFSGKKEFNYSPENDEHIFMKDNLLKKINRFGLILLYFIYELGIWNGVSSPQDLAKFIESNFITSPDYKDIFHHIIVKKERKDFGSIDHPKLYIKMSDDNKERFNVFFNFLGNECITLKKAIIRVEEKIRADEEKKERARRREERIKQLKEQQSLLEKIEEAEKEFKHLGEWNED